MIIEEPKDCSTRISRFFGSTFARHVCITVIPTLALLIIVIYLNSWKSREVTTSSQFVVRVGTRTLADNVDEFFSDKLTFVNLMRDLIRLGLWTDTSDLKTYATHVIPILTHHPSYRSVYQIISNGATIVSHKPRVDVPPQVIDLSMQRTVTPGKQLRFTRQHYLNYTYTQDRWGDWVRLNVEEVSGASRMTLSSWFVQTASQPSRAIQSSDKVQRVIPYWGTPSESGLDNGLFMAVRVNWPFTRNPGAVSLEFSVFRFQFIRGELKQFFFGALPYGIEAIIINVNTKEIVSYSGVEDYIGSSKFPPAFATFAAKLSPDGSTYTQVINNVTAFMATPIGNSDDGLNLWHVVTTSSTPGLVRNVSDHDTTVNHIKRVFSNLQDFVRIAEFMFHTRLVDDPEDISSIETALIPSFISQPMLSRINLAHGTSSAGYTFTRNSQFCYVAVEYYDSQVMMNRRYSLAPRARLQDWTVSPKGALNVPSWFLNPPTLTDFNDLAWGTVQIDPDLCPSDDISQCLSSDFVSDSFVIPLFFKVQWPNARVRKADASLDESIFAFVFNVNYLHTVLRNLRLDAVGGAAAVFDVTTYRVLVSSTDIEYAYNVTQRIHDLPKFNEINTEIINMAINRPGTKIYLDNEYYLQVMMLASSSSYNIIFLIHEKANGDSEFHRSEYYIDGLIAAVALCFCAHVAYVLIHVNDVKRISKLVADVADMRFDRFDALPMSFSCTTELRRMQNSVQSLRQTMERLKPFLGPLRNVDSNDLSYEANRVSIMQLGETKLVTALLIRIVNHNGVDVPPTDVLNAWEGVIRSNHGRTYIMDGNLVGLWDADSCAAAVHAMFQIESSGVGDQSFVVASIACGSVLVGNIGGQNSRSFSMVGMLADDMAKLNHYVYSVLLFSQEGMMVKGGSVLRLGVSRFPVHSSTVTCRKLGRVVGTDRSVAPWTVLHCVREKADTPLGMEDMGTVVEYMIAQDWAGANAAVHAMAPGQYEWERVFQQKLHNCVQRREMVWIDVEI
eukprot:PhF_6_TR40806/c0_g1_i1/m.61671